MSRPSTEQAILIRHLKDKIRSLESKIEADKLAREKKAIEEFMAKQKEIAGAREFLVWMKLETNSQPRVVSLAKEIKGEKLPTAVGTPWLYEKPIRVIEKSAYDRLYEKSLDGKTPSRSKVREY